MNDRVELFTVGTPNARVYYWSFVAANGHILADSGQGYSRRIDALRAVRRVTGLDLPRKCDFMQEIEGLQRQVWVVTR